MRRWDASKHMWPGDLKILSDRLNDLPTSKGFPAGSRPYIYMEVIDQGMYTCENVLYNSCLTSFRLGGEPITANEYFYIGRVTEFKYGRKLSDVFHKTTALKYLVNWGVGWGKLIISSHQHANSWFHHVSIGLMPDGNALVFIDNHDNQRGHGGGGSLVTFRESKLYKVNIHQVLSPVCRRLFNSFVNYNQDGCRLHVVMALRWCPRHVQLLLGPELRQRTGK